MEIKRVAKSEENYKAVKDLRDELPVNYLFCMLGTRQSGQRISVKVCEKKECKHFEKTDDKIRCTCPTNLHYISAWKLSKEEMLKVKEEIKQGKAIEI